MISRQRITKIFYSSTVLLVVATILVSCSSNTTGAVVKTGSLPSEQSKVGVNWGVGVKGSPRCDPLGVIRCMLPFPSDYYTVPDGAMPSGRRVVFPLSAMPTNSLAAHVNPAAWERNDGFSPGSLILVYVPAGTPVSPPGAEVASVVLTTGGKLMSSGLITGVTPGGYYVIEIQATNANGFGCPVWLSSGPPPYVLVVADPPTYKPGIWGPSGARPAVASEPDHTGYQDVFWRVGNGDIFETWYRNGGWNGPVDLTTTFWNNCSGKEFPKSTSAIQVAIAGNGHEYVFWRGTDGNIWEAWSGSGNCNGTTWSLKDFGSGYETWSSVSSAVTPNDQEEDIFYAGGPTGNSGHDIFEAWHRNGRWNGPLNMSTEGAEYSASNQNFPETISAVNVAMNSQGYEYVFWRYTDGTIDEAYTLSNGWNFKNFGADYMT